MVRYKPQTYHYHNLSTYHGKSSPPLFAKLSLSKAKFSLLAELALFPFKSDKLPLIRQISCR
jgi:hypothetical protein